MELSPESIKDQIPTYLTADQKQGFVKELSNFPNCNYYTSLYKDDLLQGDAWTNFEIINFEDGERKNIRGLLLSNSCDAAVDNKRSVPTKITFAPMISLNAYQKCLESQGVNQQQISNKFEEIKKQSLTSIFFLPKGGNLPEDHIVLLEDVHSIPLSKFTGKENRSKIFTLSQVGFYIFLMKLTMHFCRMHEGVVRT